MLIGTIVLVGATLVAIIGILASALEAKKEMMGRWEGHWQTAREWADEFLQKFQDAEASRLYWKARSKRVENENEDLRKQVRLLKVQLRHEQRPVHYTRYWVNGTQFSEWRVGKLACYGTISAMVGLNTNNRERAERYQARLKALGFCCMTPGDQGPTIIDNAGRKAFQYRQPRRQHWTEAEKFAFEAEDHEQDVLESQGDSLRDEAQFSANEW